jgi:hypothetical protein
MIALLHGESVHVELIADTLQYVRHAEGLRRLLEDFLFFDNNINIAAKKSNVLYGFKVIF